jgi:anti-anti-sigma factor
LIGGPDMRIDEQAGVSVARLSGDVEISGAHVLRERLLRAVRNDDLGLVVDLTDTTYLDSAGINILFELADMLRERQLRLAVVVPEASLVTQVVALVNLDSVAGLHGTVGPAVDSIRAASGAAGEPEATA